MVTAFDDLDNLKNQQRRAAARERLKWIARAVRDGRRQAEIAKVLKVTRQRVNQLVRDAEAAGFLP